MKLQNQVCTLEQGKRLKEMDIVQSSYFYHTVCPNNIINTHEYISEFGRLPIKDIDVYSAFTASELMAMLPTEFQENGKWYYLAVSGVEKYQVTYGRVDATYKPCLFLTGLLDTLSQALADMVIQLLENNHVTPDECNERLTNS